VITIQFLGAAGTVTGSKFAVHVNGRTTLVDCGLFRGLAEVRQRNWDSLPIHRLLRSGEFPLRSGDFRLARTVEESRAISRIAGPVLIISASGMATGGRVLHHLRRHLPDPRATIILAGYQAVGTRGRALEEGATSIRIFRHEVPVRAHVEILQGLSAHADADGLLRRLRTATRAPRCVFVVHGDSSPGGWCVACAAACSAFAPGSRSGTAARGGGAVALTLARTTSWCAGIWRKPASWSRCRASSTRPRRSRASSGS
jgi:Cft2 family RNA processing exonuclease